MNDLNCRLSAVIGVAVLALGAGLVGWQALAAETAPTRLGLTASPPAFELDANPGDTLEEVVRITNESTDTLTLGVEVEDFTVEGSEGAVKHEDDKNPNAFSSWFSISQQEIRLASRQSAEVKVKITVPKDAPPGGHFASVLFHPKTRADNANTGAQVIQRLGSLFLLRVSGAVVEEGSIKSLRSKSFVGQWDEVTASDNKTKILVAKDEKLNEERPQWWFDRGPVAFDLVFKNTGNVHFKPAGTLTIYNLFGRKVAEQAIDPRNVFPGGERRVTVIWPQQSLWGVLYRAQVAAVYGSSNKVIVAETRFWGLPKTAVIAVIVLLALVLILRRRLARAIGVLVQGR